MLFLLLQFGPQVPIMYDVHGSTFQPFLAIGMSGGHRCWSPGIPREPWESGDGRTRSYKQAPALRNTRVHLIPAVSQVQGIWSTYWGRDPRNFSASKGRLRRSHKFWTSPSLSQSHPWSASDIPSGGRQWAITFLLALWKHFAHRCLRTEVREKKRLGFRTCNAKWVSGKMSTPRRKPDTQSTKNSRESCYSWSSHCEQHVFDKTRRTSSGDNGLPFFTWPSGSWAERNTAYQRT